MFDEETRQTLQKAFDETLEEADKFWNNLSEEEKEKAFLAVVKRIYDGEIKDDGSYRYVLYQTFGFDMGMYACAQNAGYLDIHNAISRGIENNEKDNDE